MRSYLRAFRERWHRLTNPDERHRVREIALDIARTREAIGSFMSQDSELASDDQAFAVLAATNLPMKLKFYSLLAKRMQLQGYRPVMLRHGYSESAQQYYDIFGLGRQYSLKDYIGRPEVQAQIAAAVEELLPPTLTITSARECCFRDVPVGTYALSSASRELHRLPPDLDEPVFRQMFKKQLATAVGATLAAGHVFEHFPIRKILLKDIGYALNGPFVDLALRHDVDCLVVADGQRAGSWIFKRYCADNRSEHEFSVSKQVWQAIRQHPLTPTIEALVTEELQARYQDDSLADKRRLQSGKRTLPAAEISTALGLDPNKKTAVIFAHVSWDGAFFFGEDLFAHFDEWLLETTRTAIQNPHLNWIVKLHPLNILLHAFDGRREFQEAEMAYLSTLGELPPHVKIMPAGTPINTSSLFPLIDYGITVRGTIGLELPCFGIPVLTAGTGRYEDRGFTIDSQSKTEYLQRLAHLHNVPPLSEEGKRLARLHYYHLMLRRQVSFEDIAPMVIRQRHEADSRLFNNIKIKAQSLEDVRQAKSLNLFARWAHEVHMPDLLAEP